MTKRWTMDCRHAMVVALGLLSGSLGCAHFPHSPTQSGSEGSAVAANDEPAPADVPKETETSQPKRQPLPSTGVAFGTFNERSAADARRTPAEQEHFRDLARKAYQQALHLDPENLPALTSLARLYVRMGDHEHAITTYRRAVMSHPKEAGVWHELGICYAQNKQWEPAVDSLKEAVELGPEQRLYSQS